MPCTGLNPGVGRLRDSQAVALTCIYICVSHVKQDGIGEKTISPQEWVKWAAQCLALLSHTSRCKDLACFSPCHHGGSSGVSGSTVQKPAKVNWRCPAVCRCGSVSEWCVSCDWLVPNSGLFLAIPLWNPWPCIGQADIENAWINKVSCSLCYPVGSDEELDEEGLGRRAVTVQVSFSPSSSPRNKLDKYKVSTVY